LTEAAKTAAGDNEALADVLRDKAVEVAGADASGLGGYLLAAELVKQGLPGAASRTAALEQLAALYEKAVKKEASLGAVKSGDELAETYRDLAKALGEARRFDEAQKAIARAKTAVKAHFLKKEGAERVAELEDLSRTLTATQKAVAALAAAAAVLKTKPDDAAANGVVGLHKLVHEKDAPGAAVHLAKASDANLKKLGAALANKDAGPVDLADAAPAEIEVVNIDPVPLEPSDEKDLFRRVPTRLQAAKARVHAKIKGGIDGTAEFKVIASG
jgi:tetratricopeptide (TPR) repeat protein